MRISGILVLTLTVSVAFAAEWIAFDAEGAKIEAESGICANLNTYARNQELTVHDLRVSCDGCAEAKQHFNWCMKRLLKRKWSTSPAFWLSVAFTTLALVLSVDFAASRRWLRSRDDLTGGLVLITGGAGGLGRDLALQFLRCGANVVLWDIRSDALIEVREYLAAGVKGIAPERIQTMLVDVTSQQDVERAVAELSRRHGPVRVLVNNAAVARSGWLLQDEEDDADSLKRALRTNIEGPFSIVRALGPQMVRAGSGTVVTVGSVMGQLPCAGLADYCAAKAALGMLHSCLRWELRSAEAGRRSNVRCLLVQTYLLDTPLFEGGRPGLFPRLLEMVLPTLRSSEVARRIVLAVQTRQERLTLPWALKWLPVMLELLPSVAADALLAFAGARGEAMRTFRGRSWK